MARIDCTAKTYQWCRDTDNAYLSQKEDSPWYHHLGQNLAARAKYPAIALMAVVEAVASAVAAALVALSLIIPSLAWRQRAEMAGDLAIRAFVYSPLAAGIGLIGALSPQAASICISKLAGEKVGTDEAKFNASAPMAHEEAYKLATQLESAITKQNFEENLVFLSKIDPKKYAEAVTDFDAVYHHFHITEPHLLLLNKIFTFLIVFAEKFEKDSAESIALIDYSDSLVVEKRLEGVRFAATLAKKAREDFLEITISVNNYDAKDQRGKNFAFDAIRLAEEAHRSMDMANIQQLQSCALTYICTNTAAAKTSEGFIDYAVSQSLGQKKRAPSRLP